MHLRLGRTLRSVARLINQQGARSNAAEGSATLRKRRQDHEAVDEYLLGRAADLADS